MNAVSDEDVPGDSDKTAPTTLPTDRNIRVVGSRIESRDLFIGTREIIIGHGDDIYRLRLTNQNKLILTK
jgi:hemin uptake protein HemP